MSIRACHQAENGDRLVLKGRSLRERVDSQRANHSKVSLILPSGDFETIWRFPILAHPGVIESTSGPVTLLPRK
jgi:hypothetical protein